MDVLNEQLSSLATTQDLHNGRLTECEQRTEDFQKTTDMANAAIYAKVDNPEGRDDKIIGKPMVFNGDRKKWKWRSRAMNGNFQEQVHRRTQSSQLG